MTRVERKAAKTTHGLFYLLTVGIPLVGWAMVSASPLGVPTMVFGLFEWPHIAWLVGLGGGVEGAFKTAHRVMAYAFIGLLTLHVAAALKHHLIDRDDVLARMLPMVRRCRPAGSRSASQ
jgi:cytochrome b561